MDSLTDFHWNAVLESQAELNFEQKANLNSLKKISRTCMFFPLVRKIKNKITKTI